MFELNQTLRAPTNYAFAFTLKFIVVEIKNFKFKIFKSILFET